MADLGHPVWYLKKYLYSNIVQATTIFRPASPTPKNQNLGVGEAVG